MKLETRLLLMALLLAAALRFAPPSLVDAARRLALDAVQPGVIAWTDLRHATQSVAEGWQKSATLEKQLVVVREDARYWKQLALRHELLAGRLQADLEHWQPFERNPEPLIETDWIPATVLGETTLSAWREGRIVGRGMQHGLSAEALVIDDSQPALDAGAADSVRTGAAVLRGGTLVGKVADVGRWTSSIQWLTDPEFRLRGRIVRPTGTGMTTVAEGVVRGDAVAGCVMQLVDATAPVQTGDVVTSMSDGTGIPEGIAIGRIRRADLPSGAIHWTIEIEPAADLNTVRDVRIARQQLNAARHVAQGRLP